MGKLIRCRNGFKGKKNERCGHVVAIITDEELFLLTKDPEKGPIFRCPECPQDQRWMRIIDEGSGPTFEVIEKPKNFPDEPEYVEERKYNQIG